MILIKSQAQSSTSSTLEMDPNVINIIKSRMETIVQ